MTADVSVFRCSAGQTRLWLLEQLGRGGPALTVRAPLSLELAVDPRDAHHGVNALIRRHESLRTTFGELDGKPVQRVLDTLEIPVDSTDLMALPAAERRARADAIVAEMSQAPFDLAAGPLVRAHLVRAGPTSSIFVLVLHHLVVDGWSVRTLHDELRVLLAAPAGTDAARLPPLPVQYADYSHWQAEQRTGEPYLEHLRWWQSLHAGRPARPPVFGPPPPPGAATRGFRLHRDVPRVVVDELRAFAARHGATAFAVLLAAFATVVGRHTGEDDLVVGTPVAGRTHAELEPVVGFFVNTLPLRVTLTGDGFGPLVERLQALAAEAFERQDVPYEDIAASAGRPDRPLFDLMVNVLEGRSLPRAASSSRRRPESPSAQGATVAGTHSALELYALDDGESISLELVAADRVGRETAARILDALVSLLAAPESGRVVLDDVDGAQPRYDPSRPAHRPWPAGASTLVDRFLFVASEHARDVAIRLGDRSLTYGELRARARGVAAGVRTSSAAGDRVGILAGHDDAAVVAILGALLGRTAYVPLDPYSPAERLAEIADDAGLALVLTDSRGRKAARGLAEIRPGLRMLDVAAQAPRAPAADGEDGPACEPDDLAYIIYTSGTTGAPKGVMQSHRNVLGNVRTYADSLGLCPPDVLTLLPSVGTDAAVMDLFGALLTGASLLPVDLHAVALDELGPVLAEHGATVLHATPSVYRALTATLRDPLPGVRAVVLGGEPATRSDLIAFSRHFAPTAVLVNGFGPTETTMALQLFAEPGTALATEALPLGRPVPGVVVSVEDQHGRPVEVGGIGEIVVSGPHLALGYWGRPEETARAFRDAGDDASGGPGAPRRYRTGDLARLHPGGTLTFAGRVDDQLKVRGMRIEPAEIEAVLRRQEGVLAAGVTARSPLTAHLVLRPGRTTSPARIRRALRRALPEPMVPARYVQVDRLPLTASGKIDRRRLADMPCTELIGPSRRGAALDPAAADLAAIWADVLDLEPAEIAGEDTFFDFGGHSLLLTQVAARIADRLGVRLPLSVLFADPTLEELAHRLRAAGHDGDTPTDCPAPTDLIEPRTASGPYPLSSAQARLWFLEELDPGRATYTMSTSTAVPADVSLAQVQRAVDALVRRHESLRTTFDVVDGQPVQRVGSAAGVSVEETDLSSLEPVAAEARREAIASATSAGGFDLRRGPLLRAHLVRPGSRRGTLYLALHHIVADGWSLRLLRDELDAMLAAPNTSPEELLSPPGLQYADYALWERDRRERSADGLQWWTKTLAEAPPLLDLPTTRPRPANPSARGALASARLDDALVRSCRRLARDHDATPFMVYLAAFTAVLRRWSGQDDLVIGTPVAGRTRVETEDIVGLFVNSLPLRVAIGAQESFAAVLGRVRDVVVAALEHQDVPLEEIVRRVAPQRRLAHAPVFQVMFALGSTRAEQDDGQLGVAHTSTAKFDLSVTVDDGAGPAVFVEYATDLFDEDAAQHLLTGIVEVLGAVTANPDVQVSLLPLAREPTRARDDADGAARPPVAVPSSPPRPAGARAGLAVTGPAGQASHGELDVGTARFVAEILGRGLEAGAVVAVDLPRGPDLVAAMLAVRAAGCALLLLDPHLPPRRRDDLLRRSGAALVIDDRIAAAARERTPGSLAVPDGAPARPEAPAYIVATSGSTGEPKLVVVPRRALEAQVAALAEAYRLTPADRVLQLASLGFDVSLEEILPTIAAGGTVDLGPPDGPPSFAELDELCGPGGVSVLNLPASYWHEWVTYLDKSPTGGEAPAGLRLVVVGSEAVSPSAVARWFARPRGGCRLLCAYGTSETTITNALFAPAPGRDWAAEPRTPIGAALPTCQLLVVDPGGAPVPPGVLGELAVEGAVLATGYLGKPELTAQRFPALPTGRRYLTGDLARRRFDGALEVVGRLDDQIKIAGHRIEPGEVEAALLRRAGVAAAAVAARPGPDARPRLVAYVVPSVGAAADPGTWRSALAAELPEHLVPATVVLLDALPRTASGKLDRRRLPAATAAGTAGTATEGPAPRTDHERLVADVWAETLRLPRDAVRAASNFFQLGGDSIVSLQVAWRLAARGLPVTLADLFAHQSVESLAAHLDQRDEDRAPSGPPATGIPPSGDVPLSPIQRWHLDAFSPEPSHDNQAVLLRLDADVTAADLQAALRAVVGAHDALRARFSRDSGGWRSSISSDADGAFSLTTHAPGADLAEVAARSHASLDLAGGPLLRVELVPPDAGAPRSGGADEAQLLLVAHHLVIDLVSWQIVLADLAAALDQVRRGLAPALPIPPASWATWSRGLAAWAQGPEAERGAQRWIQTLDQAPPVWHPPAAVGTARGTAGDEAVVRATVGPRETQVLLSPARSVPGARIEDALVAALARALVEIGSAETSGDARTVLVDVEGHGRDPLLPGVDTSRTVGWFTTLRPLALVVAPGTDYLATVAACSTGLGAGPGPAHGAVRYLRGPQDPVAQLLASLERAEVSVNYLGRLDPPASSTGVLRPGGPAPGPMRSPRAPRPYSLDLVAGVKDGELVLWLSYSPTVQSADDATALLAACTEILTAVAAAWLQAASPREIEGRAAAAPARPVATYPLTPMQEAMLYGSGAGAGTGVYVEHSLLRLAVGTEPAAVRRRWERAVERHDILRTRFVEDEAGTRRQGVLSHATLPWRVVDWRHLPAPEAKDRLAGLLRDDRRRGFDPGRAPLMRLVLIRLPGQDALLWSHHHALLDGWSAATVVDETTPEPADRPGPVKPAPRPFGDYVRWLSTRDPAADAEHWARELADAPPRRPLPTHDVGAAQPRARALAADLPPGLAASLTARARNLHVSISTLQHAAWALVLGEHTRSDDVVFGVTSSGRPADLAGAESMVGLFITTHASRVRLDRTAALDDLLRGLAAQEAANRDHAHASLVDVARWTGLEPSTPLFDSLLVVENYRRPDSFGGTDEVGAGQSPDVPAGEGCSAAEDGRAAVREVPVREIPDVPLSIVVGRALGVTLVFDARRFDVDWAADVLRSFVRVLGSVATAVPGARTGGLEVLGADTRRRLLATWNDTARPVPHRSLGAQWAAAAGRHAGSIAVDRPGDPVTYARLARAAKRVAARVRGAGARPGDLVGVAGHRSAELVAAVLGVVQAGCAYVPLDPVSPDARIALLIEDTGMRVVLTEAALVPRLPSGPLEAVLTIDDLLEPASPAVEEPDGVGPDVVDVGEDEPAYVIYTSGSTGEAKGVVVPHRAVTRLVVNTDYCRPGPADGVAFASNFAFDASTFEIWGALLSGARLVPIDADTVLDPALLAATLRTRRITTLFLTTAAFNAAVAHRPDAFAPLTTVLFGGERVDARRVREALRAGPPRHLLHVYGPTEATTFASWYEVLAVADDATTVPIGRPIANTELLVLDEAGGLVPPGVEGELAIGGAGLALGYLGDPERTARRFVPHPYRDGARLYRTGDVVRQRADGVIEIRGRRDDQVKIRGFRIEPAEVETHLLRASGVGAAVVVPRRESADVHFLAAYVVPEAGAALDAADLRSFLTSRLPGHLVPTTITVLPALPLSPNGKVDRDLLPDPRATDPTATQAAPAAGTEAAIARIWSEVLALDPTGLTSDQDFFMLGGHSLLLTQVAARLRRDLHVDIPLRALFDARTLGELASLVAASPTAVHKDIPVLDRAYFHGRVDQDGQLWVSVDLRERLRGEHR